MQHLTSDVVFARVSFTAFSLLTFPFPVGREGRKDELGVRSRNGSEKNLELYSCFHHRQPVGGAALSGKRRKCVSSELGSGRHKGYAGGGSHFYWETSVYIKSVSLQDETHSHGIAKEDIKASGTK